VYLCLRELAAPPVVQSYDANAVNPPPPAHDPTDAELVHRAQRGAAEAFAALVARYQDRVYNTCYRLCHDHADALDLTQTAFLKALEQLHEFRGEARFYTWLFRIAVNLTLSFRRSRARAARVRDPGGEGQRSARVVASEPEVSAALERRELRDRIAAALRQLDDEFRVAVVLKDIEDMDYAAIAEVLDVPIGTVKSRIHRGRQMLRDLLADERATVDRTKTRRS